MQHSEGGEKAIKQCRLAGEKMNSAEKEVLFFLCPTFHGTGYSKTKNNQIKKVDLTTLNIFLHKRCLGNTINVAAVVLLVTTDLHPASS